MKRWLLAGLFLALSALAQGALKVGVVVSATGPAASLGIPERNTMLLIQEILERTGAVYRMPAPGAGLMVGETGFEPATPSSRTRCATGLRYSP